MINELGRLHHPNRPYSDPRVSIHLDDGRGFVRKTQTRYDLISYALVDSLALHSSYSSVRLESFLFTEQAFRDVKAKLKPGGVFAMYNFYRQGWVVGRLVKLAEKVFGSRPIVVSLPYQEVICARQQPARLHHVSARRRTGVRAVVESIRARFAADEFFWLNPQPRFNVGSQRLWPGAAGRLSGSATGVHEDRPGRGRADRRSTTFRPTTGRSFTFASRRFPALNLRGMAIVAALSLVILLAFAPVRARPAQRPDVLPGRGLHAAGDQGRRAHGLALRRDLDGQLDRLLRDPDHDPR